MHRTVQDLAWSQEHSTDITSLDIQHKMLASKVDALRLFEHYDPMPDSAFADYITLVDELHEHFLFEEKVMRNIGYADILHHCKSHNAILKKLATIVKDILIPRNASKMHTAITYLEKAISVHLINEDTKIKEFVHRGT